MSLGMKSAALKVENVNLKIQDDLCSFIRAVEAGLLIVCTKWVYKAQVHYVI